MSGVTDVSRLQVRLQLLLSYVGSQATKQVEFREVHLGSLMIAAEAVDEIT